MSISDDTVMAYADGELDAQAAAAVEAAMAGDAALAARVQAQRALRARLAAAFAIEAGEAVPDRFSALLQAPPAAAPGVIDLAAARAERSARRGWRWAEWGGMAAALVLGLAIGRGVLAPSSSALFAQADGGWVARGVLDAALSAQLASAPAAGSAVVVPLSFVAGDGRYCRSFAVAAGSQGDASGLAGVACRGPSSWQIELLARQTEPSAAPALEGLRQAATVLPPEVLAAVQARMQGEALDAAAEQSARGAGWRR